MSGSRDLSGFGKEPPPDRSIGIAPPPPAVPTVEDRPLLPTPATVDNEPPDEAQVDDEPAVSESREPRRPAKSKSGEGKAFDDEDTPTERRTFSLPPSDIDKARAVAAERDMWVSDLIREGLLNYSAEIGKPPTGRRRRNRKPGNYVPFTVVLEADELEALEKAAGSGRNNSWVVRAVLRRQLSNQDEIDGITDL